MSVLSFILGIGLASSSDPSSFWAVLVAGSSGMPNYRHQADVCHSYHLLVDKFTVYGAHVTVMMYDDVAWSIFNPLIGRLHNEPDGSDVYEDCIVDYRDDEVSADNFLQVLKALNPGGVDNSTLFISYVDHGEPGYLLFPGGGRLSAGQFANALKGVGEVFDQVFVYVEACNAGSVFEDQSLPENVVAMTAAAGNESSWGTFCPTPKHPMADQVNGVHMGTCLGDLFEVTWIKDFEDRIGDGSVYTSSMRDHVETVREKVSRKSHVMMYGNERLLEQSIGQVFPLRPFNSVENGKRDWNFQSFNYCLYSISLR